MMSPSTNDTLTRRIRWCWQETPSQMSRHSQDDVVLYNNWIAYNDQATAVLEGAVARSRNSGADTTTVDSTTVCQPLPGYTVDWHTLQQTNTTTGYQRPVQRVEETIVWCWQETPSQMGLHRSASSSSIVGDPADCWIRYDEASTEQLELAYRLFKNVKTTEQEKPTSRGPTLLRAIQKKIGGGGGGNNNNERNNICALTIGRHEYTVDLETLQQTKVATGFQRKVQRRVNYTPAPPPSPSSEDIHWVPPSSSATNTTTNSTTSSSSISDESRFLAIIVPHFNPQRYQRRKQLVQECLDRLVVTRNAYNFRTQQQQQQRSPLQIHIVAIQIVFDQDKPDISAETFPDVQIIQRKVSRKSGILWSKEQLVNIAWRQLPPCFQHIVWMDGDIAVKLDSHSDASTLWPDLVHDTLQRHPLAMGQIWETCDLLGPNDDVHDVQRRVTSFAAQYAAGKTYQELSNRHNEYWHPGFCWMATRAALEATDGLIHRTLGSADRHMAMAFLGRVEETMPLDIHPAYRAQVLTWQAQVKRRNIQFLVVQPGIHIYHYWHGSLAQRKYEERWNILLKHNFDPQRHVEEDCNTGLDVWTDACPWELMEDVAQYFADRQEDSVQVLPADIASDVCSSTTTASDDKKNGNSNTDDGDSGRGCTTEAQNANDFDETHDEGVTPMAAAVAAFTISTDAGTDAVTGGQATTSAYTNAFSFYA